MNGSRLALTGLLIAALGFAACHESRQSAREERTVNMDTAARTCAVPAKPDTVFSAMKPDSLKAGANDWILVPGEAAGMTHIDGDLAALSPRLGRPDAGDAAMQKSVSVWYVNHDSTGYSLVVYASRNPGNDEVARIRQIRVTAPRFETVRGIRVGTHERDIRSHYKVQEVEKFRGKDGSMSRVLDSEDGIAFEIGADGICDAIIIHVPGKEQYGGYLKLRY